jgi:3-oxoacyl-[acyl-carrier-protein] synthase II
MKTRRVAVTGLGAITPIGNDLPTFWDALKRGVSGAGPITYFDASTFDTRFACEVKNFDATPWITPKEQRRMEQFTRFAVCASKMAVDDAGLDLGTMDLERMGVYVGSGIGGIQMIEREHQVFLEKGAGRISPFLIPIMISNMAAGMTSIHLGAKGPCACSVSACASSAHAIGDAYHHILLDKADIMVAGGCEAAVSVLGIGGFCSLKALSTRNDDPTKASRPFDAKRDGFVVGEGAGILVLEEWEHAVKRGARIYAELAGYGLSADAFHMTAPQENGDGALAAMSMAIKDAGLTPNDIDYINAHGTSTEMNDAIETKAIKRLFGERAYKIPISSNKSMVGHLLGAGGGVESIATALTIKEGIIPPTINYEFPDPACDLDYVPNQARAQKVRAAISNSFGFGGQNASLLYVEAK